MPNKNVISPFEVGFTSDVENRVEEFLLTFEPFELEKGSKLVLHLDEKSGARYLVCHLSANKLIDNCDLQASLDVDEGDEIYKLNRDVTEDEAAYLLMESDAIQGRSFEDIVVEFDSSYRPELPLKVYGGQHRIRAITKARLYKGDTAHGVRVYFNLSREQKVEIATVNNTSIAVPNDLLDRMREQLLGSELRDFCQHTNLLAEGKDFADRRNPDVPTVRIARTLLVNYYKGLKIKEDDFHQPLVCKSGGMDESYVETRHQIDWQDENLIMMGKQFALLHKIQKETVSNRKQDKNTEFARKALSLSVVASWAYASGYFQRSPESLSNHYALPKNAIPPNDPLNAKALSKARLKGVDPDTYRGLGTRHSPNELGRMLEVFIVQATKATRKQITSDLANAAIQSYEAKRATFEAQKVLRKI